MLIWRYFNAIHSCFLISRLLFTNKFISKKEKENFLLKNKAEISVLFLCLRHHEGQLRFDKDMHFVDSGAFEYPKRDSIQGNTTISVQGFTKFWLPV